MKLSLNFIRGMVAAVNPCGFVLLPTYLVYFLSISNRPAERSDPERASIGRALAVSAAVSSGFMAVFVVIGVITDQLTTTIIDNAEYATATLGAAFVVLGGAMLFGYRVPVLTPKLDAGGRDRTVRSMFVYGVAYAVASLGCTLPLFLTVLFGASRAHGVAAGLGNVIAYALGMALLVTVLTVALAAANVGLVRFLRSILKYVEMLSAAFVLLSGAYLLWYFYWVDVREDDDPITSAVARYQTDASSFLGDHWRAVAIVGLLVVGAAVAVATRERPSDPHSPSTAE